MYDLANSISLDCNFFSESEKYFKESTRDAKFPNSNILSLELDHSTKAPELLMTTGIPWACASRTGKPNPS